MSAEAKAETPTAAGEKKRKPEHHFFLKLEGIEGDATDAGYEGWIPIHSTSWGLGCGISLRSSRSRNKKNKKNGEGEEEKEIKTTEDIVIEEDETNEEAFHRRVRAEMADCVSQPSLSEVTLTKYTDDTSPHLLLHITVRRPFRKAIVEHVFDRTTTRFVLYDVLISGFSISGSEGGAGGRRRRYCESDDEEDDKEEDARLKPSFSESLSLNYQSMEITIIDKVRRPITLPKAPFAKFNPHKEDNSLPLPLELLTRVFSFLDQTSLVRAALATKRLAFAASEEELKVFETHTAGYSHPTAQATFDGRVLEPYWPPKADDSGF